MKIAAIIIFYFSTLLANVIAECVHEEKISPQALERLLSEKNQSPFSTFIEIAPHQFAPIEDVNLKQILSTKKTSYTIQRLNQFNGDHSRYNRQFVKYYEYARMQEYIALKTPQLEELGYQVRVIGKSLEGRDLYAITPKQISPVKKTLLMTGRHHGDEGTANWIIEGFLDNLLQPENIQWFASHQLFLYPMINPDGAEAHTRYNKNGYDLNRVWYKDANQEKDEVKIIHGDIRTYWDLVASNIYLMLDMHGSFDDDFIYRVDQRFRNQAFYDLQSGFIDQLKRYDSWQNGYFIHSNGEPSMARIMLVRDYGINALTHESIRNIELNHRLGRNIETLKEQGRAIVNVLFDIYF
jgi:hypothetical protein